MSTSPLIKDNIAKDRELWKKYFIHDFLLDPLFDNILPTKEE
jgi:hypothetical protein